MSLQTRLATALLLAFGATGGARAHDFWIEPSTLRPAEGERVAVALKVGEKLVGEAVPRRPNRIVRFDEVAPDGVVSPVLGLANADPAGLLRASGAGLHRVLYQGNRAALQLDAAKFTAYLREEGLEKVVDERAARGETGQPSREAYSRSALAVLCVQGTGAPSAPPAPLGLTLELVPESDPCAWRAGDEVSVRLLFRGAPLAGALVEALHADRLDDRPRARTDADGRTRVRLDRPGRWLLKAVEMERARAIPDVEWESFWASLRFEVAPAP